MTNRGAWGSTINPGGSVTIPSGYHNGSGKVSASSVGTTFKYLQNSLSGWDSATLDFGSACKDGYAEITWHIGGYNNASRLDIYIEASNNNSNWAQIAYMGSNPRDDHGAWRIYGSVKGYRYARVRCQTGNVNLYMVGYMIAGIV